MDRATIYLINDGEKPTFSFDELLPSLPLPQLKDTLQRYFETLKPYGTAEELDHSRQIIAKFANGIGAELHAKLVNHASKTKNWIEEWWDAYAYHTLRLPLLPYLVMAMPLKLELIDVPETCKHLLKNFARIIHYTLEFWDLLHKEKLKPLSSNRGKVKYSSALYKRFFSTTRIPGVEIDRIEKHFLTAAEGKTPSHGIITGKGRIFVVECVHSDGSYLSPQEVLVVLQRIRCILDYDHIGDCTPILTHDERTAWAHNRKYLQELSTHNRETLMLIESSIFFAVMDENEPKDYEEISQYTITGDFHSKWADRSSTLVSYKNGKFACIGEHSAYDGTISVSYAFFIQLSLYENPEPNWNYFEIRTTLLLKELRFDLDDKIKKEIERLKVDCDQRRNDVIITHTVFDDYGKELIKIWRLHPDSFVQVIIQLAYFQMHQEIASVYETALMRHYYNGRTETLRSCTTEVYKFIKIATNPQCSKQEVVNAFKTAVEHHNHMMKEARKGNGVDRHLFGLWCVAFKDNVEIPELYSDPLYNKSGGGGNFILSTSTLGYTTNCGFVAPMVIDGYGVFYTITSDAIYIQSSAFRESIKTSAHKFNQTLKDTFIKFKALMEMVHKPKL